MSSVRMISPAPVIASLLPDSPFGEQSIRVLLDRHALEGGNRDDSDLRRRVSFGLPQPRFQETDGGVVEDRCKVVDVATCALGNEAANEHSRATRNTTTDNAAWCRNRAAPIATLFVSSGK